MRRTEVSLVVPQPGGYIEVRLSKYNDAGEIRYHRILISPDGDMDAIVAGINEHIRQLVEDPDYVAQYGRHSPISAEEITRLKAAIASVRGAMAG